MICKFSLARTTSWAGLIFYTLLSLMAVSASIAVAQEAGVTDSSAQLKQAWGKALIGKTIGYMPITLGMPLFREWGRVIKEEAEDEGMHFFVRDPNWSASAAAQALAAMIDMRPRPDVLVIHNPNVQVLAKLLEKAEKSGIYVIQVNMVSNYKTDVYVGADWERIGEVVGKEMCKDCGTGSGKSGKVAVVRGETTSAPEIEFLRVIEKELKKDPHIKLVSTQSAMWDGEKARNLTATILQQHPDLCFTYGNWGVMMLGAGNAVKQAGLTGKVIVAASCGGPPDICEDIRQGLLTKYWTYFAPRQGHDIMTAAKFLLQAGKKPGFFKIALYSPMELITKKNVDSMCWQEKEFKP